MQMMPNEVFMLNNIEPACFKFKGKEAGKKSGFLKKYLTNILFYIL